MTNPAGMSYADLTEAFLGRGDLIDVLFGRETALENAIDGMDATIGRVKALVSNWQGGTGHTDSDKFVSIADLKTALKEPS